MKLIKTYKKIEDVKKILGREVAGMEGKVYVISVSRGVCRFTESLAVYHAVIAKKKNDTARRYKNQAEKATDYEVAAKAAKTVENAAQIVAESAELAFQATLEENTDVAREAAEFAAAIAEESAGYLAKAREALSQIELPVEEEVTEPEVAIEAAIVPEPVAEVPASPYEPVLGSTMLLKFEGEYFVRIADDKLISFSALTGEDGRAELGKKALSGKSAKAFKELVESIGAKLPTAQECEVLQQFFNELVGVLNELFGQLWKTSQFASLVNNLTLDNGTYKTFLGEYPYLPEGLDVHDLVSRKVVMG